MDRTLLAPKKLAAAAVAGALLIIAFPQAAAAESFPAPDSGGWSTDVIRPEDQLPLDAEAMSKVEAALRSYVAAPGHDEAESAAALAELRSVQPAAPSARRAAAAAPTSRTLDVTQVAQTKSYYCGPASAYMMLEQQGLTRSQDGRGRTLSQTSLAGADYLKTERNQATTWRSKAMASGINRWNGGSWTYAQVQSPSGATAQGAFTSTLGANGRAIAADTVEFANQAHYNGHPTDRTIGHWIVGYGYEDSGATSFWADPSTSYFPEAAETFQVDTSSFARTYMQANGILY